MMRPLYLGDRYESEITDRAGDNVEYRNQLRARFRHAVFALHQSPDQALNYTFSLTASVHDPSLIPEIPESVALYDEDYYASPEHAIVAMAEYSGLGYDAIPAFRAAWRRGVQDSSVMKPFYRATFLANKLYDSIDADLLPKVRIPTT